MATREWPQIIVSGPYTFDEAIELMKMLDEIQTGASNSIKWIDAKTKNPVTIGYNKTG